MKTPSTGSAGRADAGARTEPGATPPGGDSKTHSNVHGEAAPRLPHEHDESSDSGTRAPSELMHIAHDDAESDKEATDKSGETNAAYDRLRSKVPGSERDTP